MAIGRSVTCKARLLFGQFDDERSSRATGSFAATEEVAASLPGVPVLSPSPVSGRTGDGLSPIYRQKPHVAPAITHPHRRGLPGPVTPRSRPSPSSLPKHPSALAPFPSEKPRPAPPPMMARPMAAAEKPKPRIVPIASDAPSASRHFGLSGPIMPAASDVLTRGVPGPSAAPRPPQTPSARARAYAQAEAGAAARRKAFAERVSKGGSIADPMPPEPQVIRPAPGASDKSGIAPILQPLNRNRIRPQASTPRAVGSGIGAIDAAIGHPGDDFSPHMDKRGIVDHRHVHRALVRRGFTHEEAAAITGNLIYESGGNVLPGKPVILNPPTGGNSGSAAWGSAQWEGKRKRGLLSPSLRDQIDHIWDEMHGRESAAYAAMKRANTVSGKAAVVNRMYERPLMRFRISSERERQALAEEVYRNKDRGILSYNSDAATPRSAGGATPQSTNATVTAGK